ncbi:MAG: hypothetical protein IH594_16390 [Bacteroidales bacterium]|nr:hypothetical protein [Bacteroidales bacterium]
MNQNAKKLIFWVMAFLMTLGIAVYQRMTGPTYPKSFEFIASGKEYKFELPRSQNGTNDLMIRLKIEDASIAGLIYYKRFNTGDVPDTIRLHRENDELVAWLPGQPAAGKLEYGLAFKNDKEETIFQTPENVVIRFKDNVPAFVLIPHVLFIFSAMLLSNLTGFYAIAGISKYRLYTFLTLLFFLVGGMIMGPVVQKYAFGEYWTGFPFGKDLTDNKALIAFVLWIIAWIGNRKGQKRRYLVILAAVINLTISLIPHSLMGSELDYESGQIKTGMIIHLIPFL